MKLSRVFFCFTVFFLVSCNSGSGGNSGSEAQQENKAPVIVSPDSVEFSHGRSGEITIEVTDPEGDEVSLTWTIESEPAGGDLVISLDASRRVAELGASVLGTYTIKIQAYDGKGFASAAVTAEVTNSLPTYTDFGVSSPVTVSSGVYASLSGLSDQDGDALVTEYMWFINGAPVADQTDSFLPAGLVQRGDEVSVFAEISDSYSTTRTSTDSVIVSNTAPYAGYLTLPGAPPDTTQNIQINHTGYDDADGDELSVTYHWSINGELQAGFNGNTLDAGVAKKNDLVEVYARISDGIDESRTNTYTFTIADAPAVVSFGDLPEEIAHLALLEFDISIQDPDEPGAEVELAYGPSGMSVTSEGHMTWRPDEVMLKPREKFSFGFRIAAEDAEIFDFSIVVFDAQRKPAVARSGVEVPYRNHSLWIGNFDNDVDNEILSTDGATRIFTMSFDGYAYTQKWLYPFRLPTSENIYQVVAADLDLDGRNEIFAIAKDGVSLIDDPEKEAKLLYDAGSDELLAAAVGDINSDSEADIVLIKTKGTNAELVAFQVDGWVELLRIDLTERPASVVLGNVDTDSALEIVLDTGYVFDGSTAINQWYYSDGFGSRLAVGDINNDGVDEIVGGRPWGKPAAYNARTKTMLWEINNSDICTVNVVNVDADPQEELLIGNCQWGDVVVYDGSTITAIEQVRWDSVAHGSISVTAGDTDNDGVQEVIWGSGVTSTGEDVLVTGELSNPNNPFSNSNPAQLDSFAAAGWVNPLVGVEHGVFVVPSTDSGYGGQRIATMDENGSVTVSGEIASNWDRAYHGEAVDYDKDGDVELFLATADTYDGDFKVIRMSDYSVEWSAGKGEYDNDVNDILAVDMNNDGYEEAVVVDGGNVDIYDVFNQTVLWSYTGSVQDVAILDPGSASPRIVLASHEEISVWSKSLGSYEQSFVTSQGCSRIAVVKIRGETTSDIICREYTESFNSSQTGFFVFSAELDLNWTFTVDAFVKDFIPEVSDSGVVNILLAAHDLIDSGVTDSDNAHLRLVSLNNGRTVWRSKILLGDISRDHNLYYIPRSNGNKQITFATLDAMYISK